MFDNGLKRDNRKIAWIFFLVSGYWVHYLIYFLEEEKPQEAQFYSYITRKSEIFTIPYWNMKTKWERNEWSRFILKLAEIAFPKTALKF